MTSIARMLPPLALGALLLSTGCDRHPQGARLERTTGSAAPEEPRTARGPVPELSRQAPAPAGPKTRQGRTEFEKGTPSSVDNGASGSEPAPQQSGATIRGSAGKDEGKDQTPATQDGHPLVKRLVIAEDVEDREPIALEQASSGSPVVAFVELSNESEDDVVVVITFEHESGKKVGFIELEVPGESPRYRTWGRTRNIRDAGSWSAVVRTQGGKKLAKKTFVVSG